MHQPPNDGTTTRPATQMGCRARAWAAAGPASTPTITWYRHPRGRRPGRLPRRRHGGSYGNGPAPTAAPATGTAIGLDDLLRIPCAPP
jgi:hypothetical protein